MIKVTRHLVDEVGIKPQLVSLHATVQEVLARVLEHMGDLVVENAGEEKKARLEISIEYLDA